MDLLQGARRALPLALLALVFWRGAVAAQEAMTVRVTYYVDHGLTYSGTHTRPGVAACSWGFPLGTRLRFVEDGRIVTCEDRGQLGGGRGWVDIYVGSLAEGRETVARRYGTHAAVEEVD